MSVLMLLLVLLGGVLSEPARVCADTSREATVGAQAEIEELRQEVEALRGLIADLARQVSRTRPAAPGCVAARGLVAGPSRLRCAG